MCIRDSPNEAQISPIYGIEEIVMNNQKALVCVGNYFDREVETTRSDAGTGFLFTMNNSEIEIQRGIEIGLSANKDARAILSLKGKNGNTLIVANNNDKLQLFNTAN